MRFKEYYLTETPVAYDMKTDVLVKKKMFDIKTKSKWKNTPPENSSITQVLDWINNASKNNILVGDVVGGGSTRMIKMNDDKTIFKFNYKSKSANQIVKEVEIYKHSDKYDSILARIYKSGTNWYIQEAVDTKDIESKFESSTGVEFNVWKDFLDNKVSSKKSLFDTYYRLGASVENVIKYFAKTVNKDYLDFLKSKALKDIIEFCIENKVEIGDLDERNIGFRGNNLVLLDWGL